MPGAYWVTAEIAELKENYSGHCYLELIEKDPAGGNIRARVRATIWAARYRMIKPQFENTSGIHFAAGLNVLLKVTVEYHELYGLSLNVSDLDPGYTMGAMALQKAEIIRRLKEEGVFEMNRELEFPLLPQRIAVISSESSAGYTDFSKQLSGNAFGFAFYAELFSSPVQGDETERGIVNALNQIGDRAGDFDLVVVLRGGGSAADLRWFDNYAIAYHITQFMLPVLTGIGHEKDISVTDMVAWKALKTPTAAAEFIINQTLETEGIIRQSGLSLREITNDLLSVYGSHIIEITRRILPATSRVTSTSRMLLGTLTGRVSSSSSSYLRKAMVKSAMAQSEIKNRSFTILISGHNKLDPTEKAVKKVTRMLIGRRNEEVTILDSMIRMSDPVNILNKGFTITEVNGVPLKDCSGLKKGDIIVTRFRDGETDSKVTERRERRQ